MIQRLLIALQFTIGYLLYPELINWAHYTVLIYLILAYLCFVLDAKPYHDVTLFRVEVFN